MVEVENAVSLCLCAHLSLFLKTMKPTSIAIVVPVYNREKELVRTFASIVAQTYRPLHVVLVDNGSTDGSLALCRELKARYEGDDLEVTVTQEAKRGPSAARNRGLSCVQEEFVSFFDSDDTYIPEAIARYMQAFDSHPQADIVGCTVEMVPEEGRPYRAKAVFSNRVEPHLFHCTLGTQRYAVRTALVRAVGGWREEYMRWEDWELGLRLLLATDRVVWIERPPLVHIYLHADSITGYRYAPNSDDILQAIAHAHADVEQSNHPDKRRLHRLLLYKQMVVAGLCRREKSSRGPEIYHWTLDQVRGDSTLRWFLPLVYRYVSWGGRGSAILAERLLH